KGRSLAIYVPNLNGGGLERVQLDLAPLFIAAGLKVTFLLGEARGTLLAEVPAEAQRVPLNTTRQLKALLPMVRYLRRARPEILFVHTEHAAIISLWARAIARSTTRIIVCQHSNLSGQSRRTRWQYRILPILFRL